MTTEKELDTLEVLKAIQKAKEVKSKLSNTEKKVSLCVGGGRTGIKEPAQGGAGLWRAGPGGTHGVLAAPLLGCMMLGRSRPFLLKCEMGLMIGPATGAC